MIINNNLDLIGNTPIKELKEIEKKYNLKSQVYVKLEGFNFTGSIKARIVKGIIEDGLKKGLINEKTTIIEPTSGNTGIALAGIAKEYKLKSIIVMPDSMSIERRNMIKAYGGVIELSKGSLGMKGAVDLALKIEKEIENTFMLRQFENDINPLVHYQTTAKEIYQDIPDIDYFISGIGTGGTISGVGKYLKEKNKNIKIIGIEPASSPLITKGYSGGHRIQGIGANFIPKILDLSVIDQIMTSSDDEAINLVTEIMTLEGISIGISSGAAILKAIEIAKIVEDKKIVVISPDSIDRYNSIIFK